MLRSLSIGLVVLFTVVSAMAGTGYPNVKGSSEVYNLNDAVGKNALTFDSDAPLEKIHGTADGITGTFRLDPTNLELTKGEIIVPVRSMKTAITKRDEHMYGAKWLDADKYPNITFVFKSLKDVKATLKDGRYVASGKAVGTFMCHGVSKPLIADVTITYVPQNDETKKRASGNFVMVTADFSVALADYNITGTGDIVGTKVGKEIKIQANLFANS